MAHAIGTLGWSEATGGRLTFGERLTLLADAVRLQLRVLPAQLRWKLGLAADYISGLDVVAIRGPDSAAARMAEEHCREVSAPYLVNHCLRAYVWARLLAAHRGLRPDEELLYVASLLHDLGLTPAYASGPTEAPCFAVRGAAAARSLVRRAGWTAESERRLAEAITLHVNVDVGLEHGLEAHLLNAGTALDVTGLRYWELGSSSAAAVLERFPRLGMKQAIWAAWDSEARRHPDCRGQFLNRYLQFGARVRGAPFPD
jgi:hypothetical protein